MINELISRKNITIYRLAKESGIPYTTINDICSGRAQLEKCSAETIYRISKVLGVSMESLVEPHLEKRIDFELYKSNVCHRLKELGDIEFIVEVLEQDNISKLYKKKWFAEALYLLAMLDYISRINNIPLCTRYDNIRKTKLKTVLFPAGVLIASKIDSNDELKKKSINEAIPEFMRFNIVESEVRNVI